MKTRSGVAGSRPAGRGLTVGLAAAWFLAIWAAGHRAMLRVMRAQRFAAQVAAGPGGRAVIVVPFDPDEAWGAKAEHPVSGTLDGRRVRGRLTPDGGGWALTLSPGVDARRVHRARRQGDRRTGPRRPAARRSR